MLYNSIGRVNCFALASTLILGFEAHGTQDHILLTYTTIQYKPTYWQCSKYHPTPKKYISAFKKVPHSIQPRAGSKRKPQLKTEDVILCCLSRALWSSGGIMISRETPHKVGRKLAA
jgi:hypothetical protein